MCDLFVLLHDAFSFSVGQVQNLNPIFNTPLKEAVLRFEAISLSHLGLQRPLPNPDVFQSLHSGYWLKYAFWHAGRAAFCYDQLI